MNLTLPVSCAWRTTAIDLGQWLPGGSADGRSRRVSPIAPRHREGPLTEPKAGAQPRPQERVLMPSPCENALPSRRQAIRLLRKLRVWNIRIAAALAVRGYCGMIGGKRVFTRSGPEAVIDVKR